MAAIVSEDWDVSLSLSESTSSHSFNFLFGGSVLSITGCELNLGSDKRSCADFALLFNCLFKIADSSSSSSASSPKDNNLKFL